MNLRPFRRRAACISVVAAIAALCLAPALALGAKRLVLAEEFSNTG